MNRIIKNHTISRFIVAIIAAMFTSLIGFSGAAFAQNTDTPAPQIPTSYTRVDAGGSIENFTITRFNGRGRFHATVVVDGVSFAGYGRYNAWNDTMSVKWYSHNTTGSAILRGSFTGKLSSDYQVLTGAYARLGQTGVVKMKAG